MAKDKDYEEDDDVLCTRCNEDITDDDTYACGECEETFCVNCVIELDNMQSDDGNSNLCKDCIDSVYPRKEKIVEKFVEVPKEIIKVMGFSESIL